MPASPFLVGVTELVRHPGERRPVHVVGPIGEAALSSARVPDGADVEVDVVLEVVLGGAVTATGTVRAPWAGECRRCLTEVEGELVTEVREVFEAHPVEGDTYPLVDDRIDLGPLAHDAVLLALPLAPLCTGGCLGPDPAEHPVAVEGDEAAEPTPDPRWAGLSELKFY